MNARALEHEGTMVEVYSKMKSDTFHVTVANCLDRLLREDQGGCERPGWSSASSRTGLAPDADPADPADPADANAATPATPPDGSVAAAPDGEGPPQAPSPGGPWGQERGRQGLEGWRGW